jgi:hypothetical protein
MRRRLHSAAALAAVGLVAAGCGGSTPTPPPFVTTGAASTPASATPGPTAGASTTPTASASTTAVGDPGESGTGSSVSDRAAADKVLTGFLGGLNAAAKAKSSAALKPLYTASCLWCAEQTKSIDLARFLGGSRTGGTVSGTTVTYRGVGKQKQLVFDVTMSVSAMKVIDRNGQRQLGSPAVSRGAFTFGVSRSGAGWVVVDGTRGRASL